MKLNLLLLMLVVIVGVVGGCSEKQVPVSELAVQNVRRAIQALATNASVKVIKESYGVRTNMAFVVDKEMRLALIRDWENHLRDIPVDELSPEKRYCAIKESSNMLNSYVSAALWDAGCDYVEIWELHFRSLNWLDEQVRLMKPEPKQNADRKDQRESWAFYQALAEWRETIVENHERFDFDDRVGMSGMEKAEEIRRRFERVIGRPVRPQAEIKRLGQYHKIVRARIAQERDAALGLEKKIEP